MIFCLEEMRLPPITGLSTFIGMLLIQKDRKDNMSLRLNLLNFIEPASPN